MADTTEPIEPIEPTELLGLPGRLLEQVVQLLAGVGIDLPALLLQGFLLVLVLVALFFGLRQLHASWPEVGALPALVAGATTLLALGIVFGIAAQALLPGQLVGRVQAVDLGGVNVALLDFRGETISSGGSVDSVSGEFVAYYQPLWHGRARQLRLQAPGCKPRDHLIAKSRLEAEETWEFSCTPP